MRNGFFFENMSQQNDSVAKEYCCLSEGHGDVNSSSQTFKLMYDSEKENSLYPAAFVITGYLSLAYHGSIIKFIQREVFVLYKRLIL